MDAVFTFPKIDNRIYLFLIIILMGLTINLSLLVVPASAQEPEVQNINPSRNVITVPLTTTISATYDQFIDPTTVTSHTFVVQGMQSGLVTETHGVLSGNTLVVTPTTSFHQGELVYAIATTRTLNITGTAPLSATQWQFNAGQVRSRCVAEFSQLSTSLTGVSFGKVEWGDYDSDGDLDILLAGFSSGSSRVTQVWRNDGGGNFNFASSITGVHFSSVAWGDYDNDGDLDILLTGFTNSFTRVTQVWRNDGGGSFTQLSLSLTGVDYSDVAWGDYDNDGDLDILLNGYTGSVNVVEVWRNDDGDSFNQLSTSFTAMYGDVTWGDYDNDGDLDILLAGHSGGNQITEVWRNDGGGSFTQLSTSVTGVGSGDVMWGDYDNDGDLDILLAGRNSADERVTEIWRNDGGGNFSQQSTAPTGVENSSVAWGDYDNDGDLDILLAGWSTAENYVTEVWRNNGGGNFTAAITGTLTGVESGGVVWGDYDDDGDLDILLSGRDNSFNRVAEVWRNDDCPFSSLSISKMIEIPHDPVRRNDPITYTIVMANNGNADAIGVHITDTLPSYINGTDLDETRTITAGESVTLTINATLDTTAPYEAIITNTAYYSHTSSSGQDSVSFTVEQPPSPNLSITKTVEIAHDPVQRGDPITYTITITNNGNADAIGVHITDTLPSYVNGSDLDETRTITAGESVTLTINVTLDTAAPYEAIITNTAYYSHTSSSGQDSVSFTVEQPPSPNLSITKTVEIPHDPIQRGDPITYTITIANNGNADAIGVHITDTLPSYINGTDLDETRTITASESVTLTINATLDTTAPYEAIITNTAYYSHTSDNGHASISFTVSSGLSNEKTYLPIILKN